MDRPDWERINHMVHYNLGLMRFENTYGQGKRKRDGEEDASYTEGTSPKRSKYTSESYIPKKTVSSIGNPLAADWDEALLEKLQPAQGSANQKRTAATDDFKLTRLERDQQPKTAVGSIERPVSLRPRLKSEEPRLEAWHTDPHQYLTKAADLPLEHDDSEMSRRSPRNTRKRAHSSITQEAVDLSSDTEQPLPQQAEQDGGEESTGLIEEEATHISSKTFKSDSGEELQGHRDAVDLSNLIKSVSSGDADTLKSNPVAACEELYASIEGDDRDEPEPEPIASKAPVKEKKWSYFDNYKKLPPTSFREYSKPKPVAPPPSQSSDSRGRSMARLPGGPKPYNNLNGNKKPSPNPQYKNPAIKSGHSASNHSTHNNYNKVGYNVSNQKKTFDLQGEHNRREDQHPRKRQRTEGTPISHNGSLKSPIDLDGSPATHGKQQGTETIKSTQSQVPKRSGYEVEEFGSLEKMMKPGSQKPQNRKSFSSDSQTSGERGGQQFNKNGSFQGTVVRHSEVHEAEDENDPISDIEILDADPRHKTTPQVVIGPGSYKGSAFRGPPRQQMNGGRSRNELAGDARPLEVSPHFPPPAPNQQQRQNPGTSRPTDDTAASKALLRDGNSGSKNSSCAIDPDESVDELNRDDIHQQTAEALLTSQRTAKTATSKPKRSRSVALDVSSDDDLANNKANISKTEFTSTKRAKVKAATKEELYAVTLVFSETDAWLVDLCNGPWSLFHDPESKTVTLLDRDNVSQWTLPTNKLEKIEYKSECEILVLHKARDHLTGSGTHIYLKLRDGDLSDDLRDSLKKTQPTISLLEKQESYLSKCLGSNLEKVIKYQKTRLPAKKTRFEEEPDDIKLAKANSQRRLESKWPLHTENSTKTARINTRNAQDDEVIEVARDKGLAGGMRTRSSSGHLEDEDLQPAFKVQEMLTNDFYGRSSPSRGNAVSLHETRSSTRGLDREQRSRQLRPRNPSPTPVRHWTKEHPTWTKDWHRSIIYPPVGKDRARVDIGDIEKLDEGEFLNDNLIGFYLQWLQDQLKQKHPEWAERIYFQNTFFYQKLSHPEKGVKGINYEAVKKWTSKVDLLDKDYIIIPINEHAHWYVAIICNAPKLLPDSEQTNHSQSQDANEFPGDEGTNTEDMPKSSSLTMSPHTSETGNGGGVNILMKDVSLNENTKNREGAEELHSVPNGVLEEQHVADNSGPPPANITSDLFELETTKASPTRKPKRKSLPPQRKYDPKEFRIITLDSLGSSHTATCSNLKDYLVLEIKDKKNVEIPRPGAVGTTAKGIPIQNNYYDCGLFLLSYIEMFLEDPDEFVSGILQGNLDEKNIQWPKAPEMRERIRELLFKLQDEQVAEAERVGKSKSKGKKTSKNEDKSGSSLTSKQSSCELSKGARVSPDPRAVEKSGDGQERAIQPKAELSMGLGPVRPSTLGQPASLVETGVLETGQSTQRESSSLGAASEDSTTRFGKGVNGIISAARGYVTGFLGHEKSAKSAASTSESSKTEFVEIEDSPRKPGSRSRPISTEPVIQESSTNLVEESLDASETSHSVAERIDYVGESKTRRQHDPQSSRQNLTRDNGRILTSPTPDAMETPNRVRERNEVADLSSPSSLDVEPSHAHPTKGHHKSLSVVKKANRPVSERPKHATNARRLEVSETPSADLSNHQSSQSSDNGLENPNDAFNGEFKGCGENEVVDSMDEDDEVQFVRTEQKHETIRQGAKEASGNDDEMLLPNGDSSQADGSKIEDGAVEDADPEYLSSSSASPRAPVFASKNRRTGSRSTPTSPATKREDYARGLPSSEYRGTKRKNPGTGGTDNWQQFRRPRPPMHDDAAGSLRDAADQAIIGKHGQRGQRKPSHIRFDS